MDITRQKYRMKKIIIVIVALFAVGCIAVNGQSPATGIFKRTKTVNVIPDNARIFIGGTEVGRGTYDLTIGRQDFVILRMSAPGYIDKVVQINKSDKAKSYSFILEADDSWDASEVNSDLANKSMTIKIEKNISKDEIWLRLNYYISEAFPDMQINDKSVGWIRTAWAIQSCNYVTVRTRMEVKEVPGMDVLTYKVRIESEYAERTCGLDDQCFKKWDRILKRYNQAVKDLQNSLQ